MPHVLSYPLVEVEIAFRKIGIHRLEEFPDGEVRWGDAPLVKPYKGRSSISHPYEDQNIDIFSIRAIISRLGKDQHLKIAEDYLNRPQQPNDDPNQYVSGQ